MILKVWPTVPELWAILLVISEYLGRFSSRTPRTPRASAWWWVLGLIASYAAQLAIVFYAARHQYPVAPWRLTLMPLPVVDTLGPGTEILHGNLVSVGMLTLAALQSFALLALYRLEPARVLVWIGCGVMLLLSFSAPALVSFDLYGYVHDALLGIAAYQPPSVPFSGEYRIFDLWFGQPSPTLYGPLWLIVVHLVTSVAPTLFGKLMALRAFSVLLFLAMLAGLHALHMPSRIRNVAALNPALMLQFVSDGHNDLIPIVLLVWAAATVRGRATLAFGLVAAAGLVKLPYAVLALPIIAAVRPGWTRIAGSIVTLAAVAALSWAAGGTAYLGSLVGHVSEYHEDVAHQVATLAALILILLAAAGGRRLRSGVWIVPMLSAAIYSWYFIWGLPYALARRRILGYLLVCFPFVTVLVGSAFMRVWELNLVLPAVVAISILGPNAPLRRRYTLRTAERSAP